MLRGTAGAADESTPAMAKLSGFAGFGTDSPVANAGGINRQIAATRQSRLIIRDSNKAGRHCFILSFASKG